MQMQHSSEVIRTMYNVPIELVIELSIVSLAVNDVGAIMCDGDRVTLSSNVISK